MKKPAFPLSEALPILPSPAIIPSNNLKGKAYMGKLVDLAVKFKIFELFRKAGE